MKGAGTAWVPRGDVFDATWTALSYGDMSSAPEGFNKLVLAARGSTANAPTRREDLLIPCHQSALAERRYDFFIDSAKWELLVSSRGVVARQKRS